MSKSISVNSKNGHSFFTLQRLTAESKFKGFECLISEYNQYLEKEALRSQDDLIAVTWLLYERKSGELVSYMSLINDSIKLSTSEKERHNLDYPFRTIPALKIAKLAVSKNYKEYYKGIGSYMIYITAGISEILNYHSACRFITVDADIEHDENVLAFYQKNGFILNSELYNKNRKTISMRKDIWG